jgi:hypothetical protein
MKFLVLIFVSLLWACELSPTAALPKAAAVPAITWVCEKDTLVIGPDGIEYRTDYIIDGAYAHVALSADSCCPETESDGYTSFVCYWCDYSTMLVSGRHLYGHRRSADGARLSVIEYDDEGRNPLRRGAEKIFVKL